LKKIHNIVENLGEFKISENIVNMLDVGTLNEQEVEIYE